VNEFYVFRQELLHSPNKLPAENDRNINGIFTLNCNCLSQKLNVTLITFNYVQLSARDSTRQTN